MQHTENKEENKEGVRNNGSTRRSFHITLINLLGAAMAAVVAVPSAAYLLLRPKSSGGQDLVEIADLAEMPVGTPQEIVYFRTRRDGWKQIREKTTTWVVKQADGEAIAFSPQCPHLGCIYHWEDRVEKFTCPCHESAFSPGGDVVAGPAPRALDRFVSRVEGGKLLVGSELDRS